MLEILLGFLPWILYFVFSDPSQALLGATLALASLLLFGWRGLIKKRLLDWVTLVFFAGLVAAVYFGEAESVARYAFVAAGAALSLTAVGSVLIGVPFTLQYSRESVPEEHQDSPLFFKVNQILSSVWGGAFVLQTVLSILYLEKIGSASLMNEVLPNLLTLCTIAFTARFPDWYTTRELSRGGVAALEGISELRSVRFELGQTAYRVIGSGPPLVMLNGSHMTLHNWDPELLEGLSRKRTLYLLDYPGVGSSSYPHPERLDSLVSWLEGTLKGLGLARFALLGYSMGGWLAQEYAARHPESVERLILIATDPGGEAAQPGAEEDLQALSDDSGTEMEQAYRMMGLMFPPEALEKVGPKLGRIYRAASLQPQLERSVVEWEDRLAEEWRRTDSEERPSRLVMPALICGAEMDRIVPVQNSLSLQKLLPHASLVLFPKSGHGLIYQDTAELLKAIDSFL